ncbi:hypothetical protein ACF0H5_013419 [Mactra antiquata]
MATIYVSLNHQKSMLKELYTQFKEGRNCDLEIRLNKRRLYVHKCLVDIFFLKAGADIESDRFYLDLQGYSLAVIETLVQFIYTGTLKCPVNLVQAVHVAAKELGCLEAMKGCLTYLDSPDYQQNSMQQTINDKNYGNQISDSASTSHSESESMDREIHPDHPPEVKIEVVDDSYVYQPNDPSNIEESLEYAKTITPSTNLLDGSSTFSSLYQGPSTDHPRTVAVPVGMHSSPEDFAGIAKRRTSQALKDLVTARLATKTIDKDGVVKIAQATPGVRGRKSKSPGLSVEYVYPKAPVVNSSNPSKTLYFDNILDSLNGESMRKSIKGVIDGLDAPSGNSDASEKVFNENQAGKTVKKRKSVSDNDDERINKSMTSKKREGFKKSSKKHVSEHSYNASSEAESNSTKESSVSNDEDAEKNEQMLFLGLAKTIDEDKRKLEQKSNSSSTGRRLRTRKKVDYSKDSIDIESLEDVQSDSEPKKKKAKKETLVTPTTVRGDFNDDLIPIRKRVNEGSLVKSVVKNCHIRGATYFPAAGTVPKGTKSAYATGSYLKTKFITESIEDKHGNVTVISKRVPVRPRQFGLDERLKNRPAVYICHPTAPVVNPCPRAKTGYP